MGYYFEAVAVAGMSGAGGQESTSGSSSRPPPPCIECLHELLASSKRLRGNAILPHEQVKVIVQHCAGVKERLEACKHRRQQQQQEQRDYVVGVYSASPKTLSKRSRFRQRSYIFSEYFLLFS